MYSGEPEFRLRTPMPSKCVLQGTPISAAQYGCARKPLEMRTHQLPTKFNNGVNDLAYGLVRVVVFRGCHVLCPCVSCVVSVCVVRSVRACRVTCVVCSAEMFFFYNFFQKKHQGGNERKAFVGQICGGRRLCAAVPNLSQGGDISKFVSFCLPIGRHNVTLTLANAFNY